MKILLVDNHLPSLEQLQICLRAADPACELFPFTDSMLAVKHMLNHPNEVDVVFTALVMKRVDGIFVTEQSIRFNPCKPVVVVGETESDELWKLLWQRGASLYLCQPVTESSVRAVLDELFSDANRIPIPAF